MSGRDDAEASVRIYDRQAAAYGYDTDASPSARLKYELVRYRLFPDARVLDIGCANGLHLIKVAPRCAAATGVDISREMLGLARARLEGEGISNARVVQMGATDLAFADASFDLVYSFSTLLLISDIERAISELARVLRPGGVAIVDLTGRWNLSQRHWNRYYRDRGHSGLRSFTRSGARDLLESNGLHVTEEIALGFLDQWKYVPLLGRMTWLDRVVHGTASRDLDVLVSNLPLVRRLANRWYVVCRKP